MGRVVSIPFTSGHVFDRAKIPGVQNECWLSQSLLHQVTYSDGIISAIIGSRKSGLNPFYIRSRIPTAIVILAVAFLAGCLNPFYIRSRIPTHRHPHRTCHGRKVSIPFTSGHVFRRRSRPMRLGARCMSQSLLHQVTYSDMKTVKGFRCSCAKCLNPFYIRSRIPTGIPQRFSRQKKASQSLLHQVTYSDFDLSCSKGPQNQCLNPFYIRSRIPTNCRYHPPVLGQECLNPFYIRSRIPTGLQ